MTCTLYNIDACRCVAGCGQRPTSHDAASYIHPVVGALELASILHVRRKTTQAYAVTKLVVPVDDVHRRQERECLILE